MGHLFSRTKTLRILLHTHAADDKTKDTRPLLNSFAIYSVYVDSGIPVLNSWVVFFLVLDFFCRIITPPSLSPTSQTTSIQVNVHSAPHLRFNCTQIDLISVNVCSRVHVNFLLAKKAFKLAEFLFVAKLFNWPVNSSSIYCGWPMVLFSLVQKVTWYCRHNVETSSIFSDYWTVLKENFEKMNVYNKTIID